MRLLDRLWALAAAAICPEPAVAFEPPSTPRPAAVDDDEPLVYGDIPPFDALDALTHDRPWERTP